MEQQTPYAKRFCGRADVYSKYRPRYPRAIISILENEISFDDEKVVADIGSGTGLLAEVFLQNGNEVWCVEPNAEMRSAAEQNLDTYKNFHSVSATAENTTLESSSVDLVTVGQALHWFDPEKSKKEFSRILKLGGRVAIVYNERKEQGGLMNEYESLVKSYAKDGAKVPEIDDAYLEHFFGLGKFKKFIVPNSQQLDLEGLFGRASSASYFPRQEEAEFEILRNSLTQLFQKYQVGERVEFLYNTLLIVGSL
jgi:ubiquinone/menaquinone biosynthesis C-methylase UbiE